MSTEARHFEWFRFPIVGLHLRDWGIWAECLSRTPIFESSFLTVDMVGRFSPLTLPHGSTDGHPITCLMRAGAHPFPIYGPTCIVVLVCGSEYMDEMKTMKEAGMVVNLTLSWALNSIQAIHLLTRTQFNTETELLLVSALDSVSWG